MGGRGPSRLSDNVFMGSFFRRPLGMFLAVMAAGLVVIAVWFAAFGGGAARTQPPPLSHGQFARQASGACMAFSLQLEAVVDKKPKSLRALTRGVRRLTMLFDRLRASWYRLLPPSSDAPMFRRLVSAFDAEDQAMHQMRHLADTRQWLRLRIVSRSIARSKAQVTVDRQMNSLANKLGINCTTVSSISA
jgi:hypothetical protein